MSKKSSKMRSDEPYDISKYFSNFVDSDIAVRLHGQLLEDFRGSYPEKLPVRPGAIARLRKWLGHRKGNEKEISQPEMIKLAGLSVQQPQFAKYEAAKMLPTLILYAISSAGSVSLNEIACLQIFDDFYNKRDNVYRAQAHLISSWSKGTLTTDRNTDLRKFVDYEWDDYVFRYLLRLTRAEMDAVWIALKDRGFVVIEDGAQVFFNPEQDTSRFGFPGIMRPIQNLISLIQELLTYESYRFKTRSDALSYAVSRAQEDLLFAGNIWESKPVDFGAILESLCNFDKSFCVHDKASEQITVLLHESLKGYVKKLTEIAFASRQDVLAANEDPTRKLVDLLFPIVEGHFAFRLDLLELLNEIFGKSDAYLKKYTHPKLLELYSQSLNSIGGHFEKLKGYSAFMDFQAKSSDVG